MPGINASAPLDAGTGNGVRRPPNWQGFAMVFMTDYVETDADSGGRTHQLRNSQPCLRLAALDIGGYSSEMAGQVWYDTLVNGAS